MSDYVDFPSLGAEKLEKVSSRDLTLSKSREIAEHLSSGKMNWVELLECYRHLSSENSSETKIIAETIIFTVEVELPQHPVFPIQSFERVAVTFKPEDNRFPGVYALRADFPKVSHLNLESFEFPRSICLYDKPYSEIKLGWTATAFIERIRNWLADTAMGVLHKAGQPLEPLLVGSDAFIILPANIWTNLSLTELAKIRMHVNQWDKGRFCFYGQSYGSDNRQNNLIFSILPIIGKPQKHGRIRQKPQNLTELHNFLKNAGLDLLDELRKSFKTFNRDKQTLSSGLILLIQLPKTREEGEAVEIVDTLAFVCVKGYADKVNVFQSIAEIGEQIDVWKVQDGNAGFVLKSDETKMGDSVNLWMLSPCFNFSRKNAPVWSGTKKRLESKIAAVGMGALGSQVFLNFVRTADGEWMTIDKDVLLPHNFVRHAAYGASAGFAKAEFTAIIANHTIEEPAIAHSIVADVLEPGEKTEILERTFLESEVILDFSASVAVARHLALDINAPTRRISLFLNPLGNDLVLLAEDRERKITLDMLEMQYYRMISNDSGLRGHLKPPTGQVRFSTSCREISNQILPEKVALCAATGTFALRRVLTQETATLTVWRSNEDGEIKKFSVLPAPVLKIYQDGWTVKTDDDLLQKITNWRKEKLPLETGGILLGSYDMQRKIIYVVDAQPAPPDSIERKTHFIRGNVGLKQIIEKTEKETLGNIQYIGEWHSHPPGYSVNPSIDDKRLLTFLATEQQKDGNPALIMIIGNDEISWHIL